MIELALNFLNEIYKLIPIVLEIGLLTPGGWGLELY